MILPNDYGPCTTTYNINNILFLALLLQGPPERVKEEGNHVSPLFYWILFVLDIVIVWSDINSRYRMDYRSVIQWSIDSSKMGKEWNGVQKKNWKRKWNQILEKGKNDPKLKSTEMKRKRGAGGWKWSLKSSILSNFFFVGREERKREGERRLNVSNEDCNLKVEEQNSISWQNQILLSSDPLFFFSSLPVNQDWLWLKMGSLVSEKSSVFSLEHLQMESRCERGDNLKTVERVRERRKPLKVISPKVSLGKPRCHSVCFNLLNFLHLLLLHFHAAASSVVPKSGNFIWDIKIRKKRCERNLPFKPANKMYEEIRSNWLNLQVVSKSSSLHTHPPFQVDKFLALNVFVWISLPLFLPSPSCCHHRLCFQEQLSE